VVEEPATPFDIMRRALQPVTSAEKGGVPENDRAQ
jgi:hypothetical protein